MPARPTLLHRLHAWLAQILAVPSGKPDDSLVKLPAGTEHDKPSSELSREFSDALEAWRFNPLARRIVGLVTASMPYLAAAQVQAQQHLLPLRFAGLNLLCARNVRWVRVGQGEEH